MPIQDGYYQGNGVFQSLLEGEVGSHHDGHVHKQDAMVYFGGDYSG